MDRSLVSVSRLVLGWRGSAAEPGRHRPPGESSSGRNRSLAPARLFSSRPLPLSCPPPFAQPSLLGSELFDLVASRVSLHEKQYFGLCYLDPDTLVCGARSHRFTHTTARRGAAAAAAGRCPAARRLRRRSVAAGSWAHTTRTAAQPLETAGRLSAARPAVLLACE